MRIRAKEIVAPCPNDPELFIEWHRILLIVVSNMKWEKQSLYVCACGLKLG